MNLKSTNTRVLIILGILAAIAGNLRFTIPGVPELYTDPREIVAFAAIILATDWRGALFVGFMAGLGGPYDSPNLYITILMHVAGLPLAFFIYNKIRSRLKNIWTVSFAWMLNVFAIYYLVFMLVFVTMQYLIGEISILQISETLISSIVGVTPEAIITAVITVAILNVKIAREARDLDTQLIEMLVKSQEIGLIEYDVASRTIHPNSNVIKMLGRTKQEMCNTIKDYLNLVHPDDYPDVKANIKKLENGDAEIAKAEFRIKTTRDNYIWVIGTAKIVERDELSRPLKVIAAQMDITDVKFATEENSKLKEKLIRTQRLESIGTMAGGIAHDFNNLLTVINGHAEMAAMRLKKDHAAFKDVNAIHSAGKKANGLTQQLLAFSRKQEIKPTTLNLNTVITELEKMQRRLIGEDITTLIELDDSLPMIKADRGQLEQILINMSVNARDAINEKTDIAAEKKITIETSHKNYHEVYLSENTFVSPGNYVLLSVSDNGIGMDENNRTKIFEPFYTTKEEGKGTGLGLAITYGIVKQNKGFISVYSEPGIGTTFKIFWPVSDEQAVKTDVEFSDSEKIRGTEEIILVEDDSGVLSFSSTALSSYGYRVTTAKDGQDALDIIKSKAAKPDLIITDMIMPRLNGKELAKDLEKILPTCAILFTSGYTDLHLRQDNLTDTNIKFLQKPYSVHELLNKTRQILDMKIKSAHE